MPDLRDLIAAAEKMRKRLGILHPLTLLVPTPIDQHLACALATELDITVKVDRLIAPGSWYLVDARKR